MREFAERKIPQSFGLEAGQILELREKARETGKSLSQLVREAVDTLLQELSMLGDLDLKKEEPSAANRHHTPGVVEG